MLNLVIPQTYILEKVIDSHWLYLQNNDFAAVFQAVQWPQCFALWKRPINIYPVYQAWTSSLDEKLQIRLTIFILLK